MTRPVTRRAVLRGLGAGGALSLAAPTSARVATLDATPSPFTADLRVMTRNLAIGANFSRLANDRSLDPEKVYDRYRQASESAPERRMRAIADEIVTAMPAVVGVQEAARIRVQRPSDYVGGSRPNATDEEFDFLTALREGLDAARREQGRSLGYRVAAVVSTTDEEFPAQPPDGERFDVRLTDRTALFVREDLSVTATEADTYATAIDGQIDDGTRVTVRRGYALAELDLGGLPTTVVTTHLEGSVRFIRHAQAAELRAVLEERTGPVVVTGDFNSGPQAGEGSAYEGFLEEYDDAWDGDEAGHTCCQWANLRNRRSLLRRRIDHVLYRGAVEPQRVWRTGEDPEARIETDTAAEMVWPSNHAGVVADLWLPTAGTDPLGVGRRVLARYAGRPSR